MGSLYLGHEEPHSNSMQSRFAKYELFFGAACSRVHVQVLCGCANIRCCIPKGGPGRKEAVKITSLVSRQFGLIRDAKEPSDTERIKDSVKKHF